MTHRKFDGMVPDLNDYDIILALVSFTVSAGKPLGKVLVTSPAVIDAVRAAVNLHIHCTASKIRISDKHPESLIIDSDT